MEAQYIRRVTKLTAKPYRDLTRHELYLLATAPGMAEFHDRRAFRMQVSMSIAIVLVFVIAFVSSIAGSVTVLRRTGPRHKTTCSAVRPGHEPLR
jgi:hypothetical protein